MSTTTIVGVFPSQQQADDALNALRNQLDSPNVSMILRTESYGSKATQNNLWNQLTQQALQLGGTMGEITGRVTTFALTAGLSVPAMMIQPMMQTVVTPMMGTAQMGSQMMGQMGNPMMGKMMSTGGMQESQCSGQSSSEQYTITLQSENELSQAPEIMLKHGATEINSYPS